MQSGGQETLCLYTPSCWHAVWNAEQLARRAKDDDDDDDDDGGGGDDGAVEMSGINRKVWVPGFDYRGRGALWTVGVSGRGGSLIQTAHLD